MLTSKHFYNSMKLYTHILFVILIASTLTTPINAGWWSDIVTTMSNSESYKKIQKWTKDHPTATKYIAGTALTATTAFAAYKLYSTLTDKSAANIKLNNAKPAAQTPVPATPTTPVEQPQTSVAPTTPQPAELTRKADDKTPAAQTLVPATPTTSVEQHQRLKDPITSRDETTRVETPQPVVKTLNSPLLLHKLK